MKTIKFVRGDLTVKYQDMRYFGYLQGFKVWVNGVKYPRQHGYWYTDMEAHPAIERALKEAGIS